MDASSPAAAAAPPLFPTPTKASSRALLSIPASTCRFAPSPASPAPWVRRVAPAPASPAPSPSKKPGRASSSNSLVRDKEVRAGFAPPPSTESTNGAKIPGRASLLPIPPKSSLPALLPTPTSTVRPAPFHFPSLSSRRHTPSPASRAPSPSKKPSHASASDKEARSDLAPPPSMGRANRGKIAGRASLSEDWVIDKIVAGNGCSKRSMTPLSDSCAGKKKPRYDCLTPLAKDSDSDSKQEFYAGPAFLNAPPASAPPKPCFPPRKPSPNPVPALLAC